MQSIDRFMPLVRCQLLSFFIFSSTLMTLHPAEALIRFLTGFCCLVRVQLGIGRTLALLSFS
jgi:hypothetical protein